MIYKPGDKVILRNDEDILYLTISREALKRVNYITTITMRDKTKDGYSYTMKEFVGGFHESCIVGLYEEPYDPSDCIESRFDIIDL